MRALWLVRSAGFAVKCFETGHAVYHQDELRVEPFYYNGSAIFSVVKDWKFVSIFQTVIRKWINCEALFNVLNYSVPRNIVRNDSIWDYLVFRKIQVRIAIEIQFSAFLIDKQFAHTAPFIEWPRFFFVLLLFFSSFMICIVHVRVVFVVSNLLSYVFVLFSCSLICFRVSSCCFRAL